MKKISSFLLLVLALFIFQCSSGGGSEMFDYVCTNGTKADGQTTEKDTQKCASCNTDFRLDNERCVGIPIAVLYEAVLGSITTFRGNLREQGFDLCNEANAPMLFKASEGYEGHTFYGSRTGTNGNFNQLPQRLGGANPGAREMRLWRSGETAYHAPTTTTTLNELIQLEPQPSAIYTNTAKIQPIFRWMQHGNEMTAAGIYRYWSFNNGAVYLSDGSCTGATSASGTGFTANHRAGSHANGGTRVSCGEFYHVLCLARRH